MKRTEDTQLLAKLMVKYAPMLPGKAIKELLEIDFIKNNFSKNTVYNYLQGARSLIKTGQPSRCIPKDLVQAIEKIKGQNKEEQPKYLERIANAVEQEVKNRVKTTEELLEELRKRKEEIKHMYLKETQKIKITIEELNEKLEIIEDVCIEEEEKINSKIKDITRTIVKQKLGIESEV